MTITLPGVSGLKLSAVQINDRYFQRLVIGGVAIGFVLLLIAGIAAVVSTRQTQAGAAWVDHTHVVQQALSDLTLYSERVEAIRRGYLLLHDEAMLAKVHVTLNRMGPLLDRIAVLTQDNPSQQARIARLRPIMQSHTRSIEATFARMKSHDAAMQALADFDVDHSIGTMDALRSELSAMFVAEGKLLEVRNAAAGASIRALYLTLGITGTLIVLVMGATFAVILRYTADLNRSQDTLRALNSGLEEAVAVRTTELRRANDEIQRFAYIVSHDLRSPLVNVMGFTAELEAAIAPLTVLIDRVDAEVPALMTAEARDAKTDLPEAIGFIRSSTAKMDRLINAILRLSREGRRTLQPVAIDLAVMTATIRDSFAHRLGEIGAEIDVADPFPPLVSDRLALEQIVSNLVENAVKYLQPGRAGRIAVTARDDGGRVVIEVADNGRGIAPGDHERIFELFRRSGVQDQPGEGLGLAHVRALAYRLGGVITCISSLGEGATFRLSLPRVLAIEVAKEPR